MSRVENMPIYEQQSTEVSALHYNLWRRYRAHFPLPYRFSLGGLRGLVVILDSHEWLCADESQNDLPVISWVEFSDAKRDTLHTAVRCKLNYYHFAAEKIREQVLQLMQHELETKLQNTLPERLPEKNTHLEEND